MEDMQIVELFFQRSEDALTETKAKYEKYCFGIAANILGESDAEECVNDGYLHLWNSIPPHKPQKLRTFLGKIVRNLALDRYEKNTAQKRGGGQTQAVLEELEECIPSSENVENAVDALELKDALNRFVKELPKDTAKVFLRRYWYLSPIKDIARDLGMSQSKVKMILLRTRNKLKEFLEKEGVV